MLTFGPSLLDLLKLFMFQNILTVKSPVVWGVLRSCRWFVPKLLCKMLACLDTKFCLVVKRVLHLVLLRAV
ncbi:hypothetical protein D9M71_482250 [compost metagenome]